MKTKPTYLYVLFISCLLLSNGYTQPGWVKNAIREAQDFTVHEDASAIILYHVANVVILKKGNSKMKVQIAVKILTRKGEDFGNFTIPIYPFRKVKKLKGWVVKPDGRRKSLSKKDVFQISTNESAGYYDDSHLLIAGLPHVEPGVVVAFEYTVFEKGWTSLYQEFVFQIQQPVKFSQFSVKLPVEWRLNKSEWRTNNMVRFEQQNNHYTWTAIDLAYQTEEPLSPSWRYLSRRVSVTCFDLQKIDFNHFPDWSSVARWCADAYNLPALPNDEIFNQTNKLVEGLSTLEEKIQAIATFCQQDIRYVAVEIGKGRWEPRAASTTLLNRFGDCKDKTTIMRAMLQVIDIPSVPVLASVVYPLDPNLATPFQFDHVIIAIQLEKNITLPNLKNAIVDKWLFFDPTDPSIKIGEIPWVLQGSVVLLGAVEDSVIFRLPYQSPNDNRRVYQADATLNTDGSFAAEVKITDFKSWAISSRYKHRIYPKKKQIESWRNAMSRIVQMCEFSNYQTGENRDSVWVSFTIQGKRMSQKTGQFDLLRPDFFNTDRPPQLPAKKRQHPIWFGQTKEVETKIVWHFPDTWIPEVDTTTFYSYCDAASIYSKISLQDNILHFNSVQKNYGRLMDPEEYEEAHRFSKDLNFVRKQTVIFNRY